MYFVIVEYEEAGAAREAFQSAVEVTLAAMFDESWDMPATLERPRKGVQEGRKGVQEGCQTIRRRRNVGTSPLTLSPATLAVAMASQSRWEKAKDAIREICNKPKRWYACGHRWFPRYRYAVRESYQVDGHLWGRDK